MWRMYKELFNGGWRISDSWWSHLQGLLKFHISGNSVDDPLMQYIMENPEELVKLIMEHLG